MSQHTVVHLRPGPAWVPGRQTREQPLWDEHAAFIDGLHDRGLLLVAGPYADGNGALQIFAAGDTEAVRDVVAQDPWVVNGVFAEPDVRPWLIWVGGVA
jgi:uncharacterized protein YciI